MQDHHRRRNLYLWKDPPLQGKPGELESLHEAGDLVILGIPKEKYKEMTELVDLRPIEKAVQESKPADSYLRKIIQTEPDLVRKSEWQCTSVIHLMRHLGGS